MRYDPERGPWPVDPPSDLLVVRKRRFRSPVIKAVRTFGLAWSLVLKGHKAHRVSDDTLYIMKGMPDV